MSIVTFDTKLPKYAAPCERPVLQTLVDLSLWDSGTVSIWDGEELSVQRSTDKLEILNNLAQTEMDQLEAYDKDCLLYTSPSPRDRTRSRMPSSA